MPKSICFNPNSEIRTFSNEGQDYEKIRKRFDSNNLFTDDIFKADINALAYSLEFKVAMDRYKIKWMRPKVIFSTRQVHLAFEF